MSSQERLTADTLVVAYNTMDTASIIALRTPDCKRVFLPHSLAYAPQSNDAFKQNLAAMASVFTSFHIVINDVVEGLSSNGTKTIVMYVSASGETAVGDYRNEYVWKMGFTDDGRLIKEWSEFVDVGVTRDFYPLLKGEIVRKATVGQARKG